MTDLSAGAARDIIGLFVGKCLGQGCFRKVYLHALNPELVLKIEEGAQSFSNIREWDVWQELKDTPSGRFLAPCVAISPGGAILIQRRTMPVWPHELPKKVPAFLTDLKAANWGRIGRRVVCHDYANHLALRPQVNLVKARWWNTDLT